MQSVFPALAARLTSKSATASAGKTYAELMLSVLTSQGHHDCNSEPGINCGLRVKDLRELEKAAELLCISPPCFSLVSCLQFRHRLSYSTVRDLDVSGP